MTETTSLEPAAAPPAPEPSSWRRWLPDSATGWAWWVARAAALGALVWFFVTVMGFKFNHASSAWSLQGDQHQSIGHFWRYAVDGAIPPGHLLSDYAFAYHSPPLWWAVMAASSSIWGPLASAKALGLLAYALFALGAVFIVGRRTEWVLGLLVGMLVLRNPPDMPEQITGGMARSMGPALLYLFLYAYLRGRHHLALVSLVLQAAIYPSVVIPCGITYGIDCLVRGPMPVRTRRVAQMFVAGVIVLVLGKSQDFSSPEWWGDPVTYAEAEQMPAWSARGRFPEVPHRTFESAMQFNLVRPYKDLGNHLAGSEATRFVGQHLEAVFLGIPLACGALGLVFSAWRRRRAAAGTAGEPAAFVDDGERFPWQSFALFAGSLAGYALVRALAFKLFLPSRQLGFTLQFIIVATMPLLVWYGTANVLPARMPARRALLVVVTALLTVLPAFAFRGDGCATTAAGYLDHQDDKGIWSAVRKLPLDAEVACDIPFCEYMMPLGQHVPYAARNLTHPLRKGFYEETERRLVESQRVLHATRPEEIHSFVKNENVRYLMYHKKEVGQVSKRLYQPAMAKVQAVFSEGRDRKRLLLDPPKEAVVFRLNGRYLVDLSRFPTTSAEGDAAGPGGKPGSVDDDAVDRDGAPRAEDAP
jgi:hypothetical protein